MTGWSLLLWVIYPYVMLTLFVAGHIYRYRTDQLSWKAKSSEFLEKRKLRIGSLLFHYGILCVFVGHVVGLLIPKSWLSTIGLNDRVYHLGAVYGGGIAGLVTFLGILLLLIRRTTNRRIRVTSSFSDILVVLLLLFVISIGVLNTIGYNLVVGEFDYRATIGPWFRGLFTFTPNVTYMQDIPLLYAVHVFAAFAIFGLWPFTRLVHVWSVPLSYLRRSYILYVRRGAVLPNSRSPS